MEIGLAIADLLVSSAAEKAAEVHAERKAEKLIEGQARNAQALWPNADSRVWEAMAFENKSARRGPRDMLNWLGVTSVQAQKHANADTDAKSYFHSNAGFEWELRDVGVAPIEIDLQRPQDNCDPHRQEFARFLTTDLRSRLRKKLPAVPPPYDTSRPDSVPLKIVLHVKIIACSEGNLTTSRSKLCVVWCLNTLNADKAIAAGRLFACKLASKMEQHRPILMMKNLGKKIAKKLIAGVILEVERNETLALAPAIVPVLGGSRQISAQNESAHESIPSSSSFVTICRLQDVRSAKEKFLCASHKQEACRSCWTDFALLNDLRYNVEYCNHCKKTACAGNDKIHLTFTRGFVEKYVINPIMIDESIAETVVAPDISPWEREKSTILAAQMLYASRNRKDLVSDTMVNKIDTVARSMNMLQR